MVTKSELGVGFVASPVFPELWQLAPLFDWAVWQSGQGQAPYDLSIMRQTY